MNARSFGISFTLTLLLAQPLIAQRRLVTTPDGGSTMVYDVDVLDEGPNYVHVRWSFQGFPGGADVAAAGDSPGGESVLAFRPEPSSVRQEWGTVEGRFYCCNGVIEGGGYTETFRIWMWPSDNSSGVYTTVYYPRGWVDERFQNAVAPSDPTTAPAPLYISAIQIEPGSGGARVTIRGEGFAPDGMRVEFRGAYPVLPEFFSGYELRVTVPQGARDGTLTLRHPDGRTAESPTPFVATVRPAVRVRPRTEERVVVHVTRPRTRACSLRPVDDGGCKASFDRFYFDPSSGQCKSFVWGGCGGVVPFETLAECVSACERR